MTAYERTEQAGPLSRRVRRPRERAMVFATANGLPPAQGLYDPRNEHDACGVGFVANMHNAKSHELVRMGLQILLNLDHRGAVGADPKAGDGCGMLMQIPHRFFAEEAARLGFALPEPGLYAVGALFMPRDAAGPQDHRGHFRARRRRTGPEGARLARRAGRSERPRRDGQADRAGPSPDFHRPRRGHAGPGDLRAPALS